MKNYSEINERFSGIEILRCLCIYFVLLSHYSVLGNNLDNIITISNCLDPTILYMQESTMFSRLACSVFILITGYYSIQKDESVYGARDLSRHYLKAVLLCLEMLFYSLSALLVTSLFKNINIGLGDIIKSFMPVFYGNWYIKSYLCLYLLIPYMNRVLRNTERRTIFLFIVFFLLVWSVIPTINGRAWDHYGNFDMMLIMYVVGAYISLFKPDIKVKRKGKLLFSFVVFIHLLSVPCFDLVGKQLNNEFLCKHAMFLREYSSVSSVFIAIGLFLIFKEVKVKNRFINEASKGVLAVYLIHLEPLLIGIIWDGFWPNRWYITKPWFHLPIKCLIILCACLLIDFIRRNTIAKLVDPPVKKLFFKIYKRLSGKINEKLIIAE